MQSRLCIIYYGYHLIVLPPPSTTLFPSWFQLYSQRRLCIGLLVPSLPHPISQRILVVAQQRRLCIGLLVYPPFFPADSSSNSSRTTFHWSPSSLPPPPYSIYQQIPVDIQLRRFCTGLLVASLPRPISQLIPVVTQQRRLWIVLLIPPLPRPISQLIP
jgi:hypothetical protein